MPILNLKTSEKIKVFGPASLIVREGSLDVLGKRFRVNDRVIVHMYKSYVVHALEDSKIELILGEQASIQPVEPGEPYSEWISRAEEILSVNPEKIIVLGGVDEGKSSYTVLLSNKAVEKGLKPAVIDADVGQADIGPPAFISMSYPDRQVIWLRELKPVAMRFIGDIKPQNYKAKIIAKIGELIDKALKDGRRPVIIDTDGWINDNIAILYKSMMIEELKPDIIVVLGENIHGFFTRYRILGSRIYELRSPSIRRSRNREERRRLRSDKYREFLAEAKTVKIPMDNIIISGTPVFTGIPLDTTPLGELLKSKILYASKTPDTLYIVLESPSRIENAEYLKKIYGLGKFRVYVKGFERDHYVALTDSEGNDYPGVIEKIDYENRLIYVKTLYTDKEFRIIKFSKIKLTKEFTEQLIE